MERGTSARLAKLIVCTISILVLCPAAQHGIPPSFGGTRRIIIAGNDIFDGKGSVLHNTRIVIEGSRIIAVTPAAEPIDYTDKMPKSSLIECAMGASIRWRPWFQPMRWGEAIGLAVQIGSIAPGLQADIIALDGNPLMDITAVRRVVFVMKGRIIYKNAIPRMIPRQGLP